MYYIKTLNRIEGYHCWPSAPSGCDFLRARHRHIFEVTGTRYVEDGDREVEIISAEHQIEKYLHKCFGYPCEFGEMSCENIARKVCEHFNFSEVTVLEDGISGGGWRSENVRGEKEV